MARLEARREKSSRYQQHNQRLTPKETEIYDSTSESLSSSSTTDDDDTTNTNSNNSSSSKLERTKAQIAFENGVQACPRNVHLLQAWAIYESQQQQQQQPAGDCYDRARELFEQALELEPYNPYVCHAYSLMEKKLGNAEKAIALLQQSLNAPYGKVTAALVCSLGEYYTTARNTTAARDLYQYHLACATGVTVSSSRQKHLPTEKDRVEVYLAAAWLEERHFRELSTARELLKKALAISPTSSLANVALARLEGRISAADAGITATNTTAEKASDSSGDASSISSSSIGSSSRTPTKANPKSPSFNYRLTNRRNITEAANQATKKQLMTVCDELHKQGIFLKDESSRKNEDGRVFNALASMEIKERNFKEARDVLRKGMELYPNDHNLFTAAGKVEERVGNYTGARHYYSESLQLEPSAPTLVAFALLELKLPMYPSSSSSSSIVNSDDDNNDDNKNESKRKEKLPGSGKHIANFTLIRGLFEEALMLDPRNGPAYNAYGNAELHRGNTDGARNIFERGTLMNCSDSASLYHGYGMLEISSGNIIRAREILYRGLDTVKRNEDNLSSDKPNRDRAAFLSHTLGMLELNSHRPSDALGIFTDGLERCGNSSQLLLGAALSEMRLGKDEAARRFFERSIIADPKHAQAWQAWGVMETKAGHFNKASSLFQQGIKNAPWHGSLWHGYASLEVRRGNIDNARTLFIGGLKKSRSRHDALYQSWAAMELREGNYRQARKLISEALTRNKRNGRGWIIAAQIEIEDGRSGLAELLLRRGIECDPDNAELYRMLGSHLFYQQGKIDDARNVYEKGIEIDPMYASLYHSLAELEASIFNLDALSKLNARTKELFKNNNAVVSQPPSVSYQTLENKINHGTNNENLPGNQEQRRNDPTETEGNAKVTKVVSALADKIVVDDDDDESTTDSLRVANNSADNDRNRSRTSPMDTLSNDGLVGDLMSVESILNDTDTTCTTQSKSNEGREK